MVYLSNGPKGSPKMISLPDLFNMSLSSLFENTLRAVLSLLGIAIGIAAVFMIFTLSQGGKRVIFSELETLGLNSFFISRDYKDDTKNGLTITPHTGITESNLDLLFKGFHKKASILSPVVTDDLLPIYQANGKRIYSQLMGVNSSYLTNTKQKLSSGRKLSFFDIEKKHKVVVVTESIINEMRLSPQEAIKKTITIGETIYQIIGVLEDKNLSFLSSIGSVNERGLNNSIYLPYNILLNAQDSEYIAYIYGEIINKSDIDNLAKSMITRLTLLNLSKFDYRYSSMDSYISVANKILKNVTFLGGISSLAALFVGGIGIMNMMSTSVVERTAEIGLRKALGASNLDIKKQIILESLLITIIGSLFGIIIGLIASFIISLLVNTPFSISPLAIFSSIFITLFVGVLSGYIPANKAASITPVEALNHE